MACLLRCHTTYLPGAARVGKDLLSNSTAAAQAFECQELLYTDYARLPADKEKAVSARYVDTVEELVR